MGGWVWGDDDNTPILHSLLYRPRHRWPPRVKSMLDYHCEWLCPLLSCVWREQFTLNTQRGDSGVLAGGAGDGGGMVCSVVVVVVGAVSEVVSPGAGSPCGPSVAIVRL